MPKAPQNLKIEIRSPATIDTEATLLSWKTLFRDETGRIDRLNERQALEPDDDQVQELIEEGKLRVRQAQENISTIQSANTIVGLVHAAGGYRQDQENWALDWALVATGKPDLENKVSMVPPVSTCHFKILVTFRPTL